MPRRQVSFAAHVCTFIYEYDVLKHLSKWKLKVLLSRDTCFLILKNSTFSLFSMTFH